MIIPVIMAGGSGSRLWPLSRQAYPKQFLNLQGDNTMLQDTLARLNTLQHGSPMVICNEDHRFTVAEQLRLHGHTQNDIILEPVGRNTAPAVALAAFRAVEEDSEATLLVLAADHIIKDPKAFVSAIESAMPLAEQNVLVTFGIVPTTPETGYGYIKQGQPIKGSNSYMVDSFVEKPDLATAQDYVATGNYLWNSGMFLFKAAQYLNELKQYRPDIYRACELACQHTSADLDFVRIDQAAFEACPDESIDYAVMENTEKAAVVPLDCGWSDVGSWSALWEVAEHDNHLNASKGDVLSIETTNSYLHSTEKLIATVGVDNLIVVETKDAVLVADKSKVQQVKQIVDTIKSEQRSEWQHHREVYRPWGKFDSIDNGERFQVKRISVKPGGKLSVQMHYHRAEHWVVVSGTAKVRIGEEEVLLTENQSTYIPVGEVHSLENPGQIPLELIEVRSGSYLEEDDIIRLDDKYGRQ
ncbi:mannose-1-phosphate guanyltransferase [Vibrio sp. qd031]|uniref:mannose-1-phosphate guanylyltransferase n=1 Tax=Vibrio ulleungensis TaxID=2807619 RepID=A0ABS2HFE4_9VIBR|nr:MULTISPECIES: mannose-1-phosphate guanylyltransferase/mannose-6-phosphate isomerase [Vibrio]MBM7036290.1 mannose-1-phosphate guanylyltransferase/mannose-6-phosphate isomerase [Vibrio ulleungensis]ORT49382.1 mannose-1-phosphate guanyltransferase [Vibrio sp. qd031]